MSTPSLGKLERVDLRAVWSNETDDFTPWLAAQANLDDLGETLGMQLELQATEEPVGPYFADIVCQDLADDSYVVIENQLEVTNHDHLGKLLTYAAHFKASTVIWVAKTFTDQHRAAVDWLNDMATEGNRFFGLEVEVWRIGESAYAPKFNVVAKPNSWTKGGQKQVATLSEARQLQLDFWHGFHEYVAQNGLRVRLNSAPAARNWMAAGRVERPGFLLSAIASTYSEYAGWGGHELRAELLIRRGDLSTQYHQRLQSQKAVLEQDMESELKWSNPQETTAFKIYSRKDVDLHDTEARSEQYAWLLEQLESFHRVFGSRIRELDNQSEGQSEG